MKLERMTNRSLKPWFRVYVWWKPRWLYLRLGRREWILRRARNPEPNKW